METVTLNETQKKILEMLTTSTGTSILDSGGAYGRDWERNQAKGVEGIVNAPAGLVTEWGFELSTFHFLSEWLTYSPVFDAAWNVFDDLPENRDETWRENIDKFLDVLGVEPEGEFYSDARKEINSYNWEYCLLDQTVQFTQFGLGGECYVALQIHGGADIRGGYTKPVFFTASETEWFFYADSISGSCNGCELRFEYRGGNGCDFDGEFEPSEQFNALDSAEIDRKLYTGECPNCNGKEFTV